mmetsp:Transcript_34538/g.64348  ORF Transcript_34538/g.64348 Transcript_34538/m.64348 type:complete len:96 (-) Transcript_34538:205-492(-)
MTKSMLSRLLASLLSEKSCSFQTTSQESEKDANPVQEAVVKTKKRRPAQKAAVAKRPQKTQAGGPRRAAHITDVEARHQAQTLCAMGGFPMPFLP